MRGEVWIYPSERKVVVTDEALSDCVLRKPEVVTFAHRMEEEAQAEAIQNFHDALAAEARYTERIMRIANLKGPF